MCKITKNNSNFVQKNEHMKFYKILIFILLLSLSFQVLHAQRNRTYVNYRFGFVITFPDIFDSYTESANSDGILGKAQDIEMRAYAINNVFDFSSNDIHAMMKRHRTWFLEAGCTVTYQFSKGNTCVLSGYTADGEIYYEKSVLYANEEIIATIYYQYAKTARALGDKAISLIGNFPYE